jgi:hypothetical protein
VFTYADDSVPGVLEKVVKVQFGPYRPEKLFAGLV